MSESILDSYRIIHNVISLKAKNTHAVFCQETGRCLSFTNLDHTIKQMECEQNVRVWHYFNKTNMFPMGINLNLPFEFVFDPIGGNLIKKPLTENEVRKYLVLSEKSAAYDVIGRAITRERNHIRGNIPLQGIVHSKKYDEAVSIQQALSCGHDLPSSERIPYIMAEADLTGEDLSQIANKIIQKRKFQESRIFNTEVLRMKYVKQLRTCSDVVEINYILDEFKREANIYGRQ